MTITSLLFYLVMRRIWKWKRLVALPLLGLFLVVDLSFFSVNLTKIAHGGWIPVLIALSILTIMLTWKKGRQTLAAYMARSVVTMDQFFQRIEKECPIRVNGTAVFMTLNRDVAPSVLLHSYEHNRVLHQTVILLSIITEHVPEIPLSERVRVTDLSHGFIKIVARYGYMESADVQEILSIAEGAGLKREPSSLSFYLGRETFVLSDRRKLSNLWKRLFMLLSRNARSASEYFNLPPDSVIEIGTQITL